MKQSTRKLCLLLMVMCLLVGLLPLSTLAAEEASSVEFLYQQLTLGDDLTMNFEVAIEETVAANAVVDLTVDGSVTSYTVSKMTANERGNYVFSVDVAAAQMTQDIHVAVTVDGSVVAERNYTVLAYAKALLQGNYSKETKALLYEMLNYGAAAQNHFKYNVDALANAGYEDKVTPASVPTEVPAVSVNGSVSGISYYGSSMLFTGKLAVRYYFTAPNGVDGYTFTDANGNSYETDEKNGLYYVDVAGINPQDIDEAVVLTVSDGSSSLSVGYGPMHYITRMYNGKGSESLNALLQAMYGYHLAAETYIAVGEYESTYPAILPSYQLNREENQLEVVAFWAPPITEEHYTWMKEAGVTALVLDNKFSGLKDNLSTALSLCDDLDIDVYLSVPRATAAAGIVAGYLHYADHPSLKGFYTDEPITKSHIDGVAAMYEAANAVGLRVIVNMVSGYYSDPNQYAWIYEDEAEFEADVAAGEFFADYAEYLAYCQAAFAGANSNLVVSATNYSLNATDKGYTSTVGEGWLSILNTTNGTAQTVGGEMWQYVSLTGLHSSDGESNYMRQPTEADIRWQYYTALAYGVTGIENFVYTSVAGAEFDEDVHHGAIWWTDEDDTSTYYKTDVYDSLQTVTREISRFDHVLLSFNWQGVMVNAVNGNASTTAALNNAGGVLSENRRINSISSTKDLLVGCFQDDNNYDGFLVVNFDETADGNSAVNTVSITFEKAYTALAYVKGERQVVTLTDGVYSCELLPGEAVFVIPVEGDVTQVSAELAIPENAVLVEDFADCAAYQDIAGVKALTDGTYTDVLPADFDYSGYTHITLRMKLAEGASVTVGGKSISAAANDWADVTIKLSELNGTDVVVTGNIWIDQIFATTVIEELPIPADATLVTDYSHGASPWNSPYYGSGAKGTTAWYKEYDGVAGVQAFAMQANSATQWTLWTSVLPADFDYSAYTHITFRMKANKSALRAIYMHTAGDDSLIFINDISVSNEWTTVTLALEDLPGMYLAIANVSGVSGEMVWIDQVYVRNIPEELPIPEGATLVTDYSTAASPWNSPYFGSGAKGTTVWHDVYDGVAGVQAFGKSADGYTLWTAVLPADFDYSAYTYITLRMKLDKSKVSAIALGTTSSSHIFTSSVTEDNVWTTVTMKLSDLPGYFLILNNAAGTTGEMVWIDQVWVSNAPNWTVTVTDGSIDYEGQTIPDGTTITLTHDDSATPEYYSFNGWKVNGAVIEGNTVVVTEDMTIEPVYVCTVEEVAIPEGATLVTDYSTAASPWNSPYYGNGAVGVSNWYEEYDGVAGVQAFGKSADGYTLWTAVLPSDFDYTGYTHITLRMKLDKSKASAIALGTTSSSHIFTSSVTEDNVWTTVTMKLSDLPAYSLILNNVAGTTGEMVWIDQVYVETRATELAIPEGATLVTDYSAAASPWNSPYYGNGAVGVSNWYEEYDGVAGVQAFGKSADGYTLWTAVLPSDFDYTGYTHITLRLKVDKSKVSLIAMGTASSSHIFTSSVEEDNTWITVTMRLSNLPGYFLILNNVAGTTGEMVWIDQVYVETRTTELAIPEGATMICDYSQTITPHIPTGWGTPANASYTSYDEYDGRAGVFGMGATGEGYMWYNDFGMNNMDLSNATTITFRLRVKSGTRALWLRIGTTDTNIISDVTAFDQWIELTYNVADLGFSDLSNATIQFRFATAVAAGASEWVWIDQVYVQ